MTARPLGHPLHVATADRPVGAPAPATRARVPTLFITGAPGSGKTTLAREMSEILALVLEPYALIDLDELARGVIPEQSLDFNLDLAVDNLAAVWET